MLFNNFHRDLSNSIIKKIVKLLFFNLKIGSYFINQNLYRGRGQVERENIGKKMQLFFSSKYLLKCRVDWM